MKGDDETESLENIYAEEAADAEARLKKIEKVTQRREMRSSHPFGSHAEKRHPTN